MLSLILVLFGSYQLRLMRMIHHLCLAPIVLCFILANDPYLFLCRLPSFMISELVHFYGLSCLKLYSDENP